MSRVRQRGFANSVPYFIVHTNVFLNIIRIHFRKFCKILESAFALCLTVVTTSEISISWSTHVHEKMYNRFLRINTYLMDNSLQFSVHLSWHPCQIRNAKHTVMRHNFSFVRKLSSGNQTKIKSQSPSTRDFYCPCNWRGLLNARCGRNCWLRRANLNILSVTLLEPEGQTL